MNHIKRCNLRYLRGSEGTNIPVDWRCSLAFRNIMDNSKTKTGPKLRTNTDGKTRIFRAEIGTGSVGMDDDRHHHAHVGTHCHQLPALATPDCHVPRNCTATLPPQHRTPTQLTLQSATASLARSLPPTLRYWKNRVSHRATVT